MPFASDPDCRLVLSYMTRLQVPLIARTPEGAMPNDAFAELMPECDGHVDGFSWDGAFDPGAGCETGRLTADWTGRSDARRRLQAEGFAVELRMPGGQTVLVASAGGGSRLTLLCLKAAVCAHLMLSGSLAPDRAQKELDAIPHGVSIKDAELRYIGGNRRFVEFARDGGYLGKNDYDMRWREKAADIRGGNVGDIIADEPGNVHYLTTFAPDGALSRVKTVSMSVTSEQGRFLGLVTVAQDISDSGEDEDSLLYSALHSREVQQGIIGQSRAVALVVAADEDASVRFITGGIRQYGYDADAMMAEGAPLAALIHPDDRESFLGFVRRGIPPGEERTCTVRLLSEDGRAHAVRLELRSALGGAEPSLEGTMVDIGLIFELQEKLREESRSVRERISRMLGEAPQLQDSGMSIGRLVDIDRLQRHQDTLAGIFRVSAVLLDFYETEVTEPSNRSAYLCEIHDSAIVRGFVRGELHKLAKKAGKSGEPVTGLLPASMLHTAAIPIMQGQRHIATWIIGGLRPEQFDGDAFAEHCHAIGLEPERALPLYRDLRALDAPLFARAVNEFARMASLVSVQCIRSEHLISQAEASRSATRRIVHSLSQQRLINRCHTLSRTARNLSEALDGILQSIGTELEFSRAYIFERRASGLLGITHEWHAEGVAPVPWEYRVIVENPSEGTLYEGPGLRIVDMTESAQSPRYRATGTKSSVHLPVFSGDGLEYVIVLEECANTRIYFRRDQEYLDTLLRLVSSIVLRRGAEREMQRSYDSIGTVMRNMELAIFACDPDSFRVLYVNDCCERSLQVRDGEAGFAWDIFPELRELMPDPPRAPFELTRDGKTFLASVSRVPWLDGRSVLFVSAADITLNKAREKLIERLAHFDPLLGIPNRRKFERDLELALRRGTGGLVFMDLDDFKLVNDGLGHNRGDMLLKAIVRFFQGLEATRDRLYRLGGDEFMLILEGLDSDRIADVVESIWERFQRPWKLDGLSILSTVSIGVSRYPEDGRSPKELLRFADVAMYKAKYEGKNSAVFFRKGLEGGVTQRMNTENRLRAAVAGGFSGFEVHYQPVVDLNRNRVSGAEALLRWRDEEGGLLYPDAFLSVAESLGLMGALGLYVLRCALRDLKRYCDEEFLIVTNLSMRQFQGETLADDLLEAATDAGVPPERIVLGVDESAAAYDMQSGDNTLGRLRRMGFRISLDNKGSSYNALSRVVRADIDYVNIDISLIGSMQHDPFSNTVVQTSIELAKSAGCGIFCAGVEVQEQYLDLRDYGCDFAQGYFFSRALPLPEFEAYMAEKRSEPAGRRRISRF